MDGSKREGVKSRGETKMDKMSELRMDMGGEDRQNVEIKNEGL